MYICLIMKTNLSHPNTLSKQQAMPHQLITHVLEEWEKRRESVYARACAYRTLELNFSSQFWVWLRSNSNPKLSKLIYFIDSLWQFSLSDLTRQKKEDSLWEFVLKWKGKIENMHCHIYMLLVHLITPNCRFKCIWKINRISRIWEIFQVGEVFK